MGANDAMQLNVQGTPDPVPPDAATTIAGGVPGERTPPGLLPPNSAPANLPVGSRIVSEATPAGQGAVPGGAPSRGRLSRLGSIAESVLGAINGPQTRPQMDASGKMTEVPVPQDRPGQIFRHILAGAILGGAAAQEEKNKNPRMGFGGGVVAGGKAAIQENQQQKEKQQKTAKEDWERDQEQQKNAVDTALKNTQRLGLLKEMAGKDLETHEKVAAHGKLLTDALEKAGVSPAFTLSEAEAAERLRKNPEDFARYEGIQMDTVTGTDKDGNPQYSFKIAFYDKNASVTITQGMRDYFKESGLLVDKKNDAVLKVGKVLTWKEAGAIFQQADANTIKNLQNQEQQQRIATSRAEQAVHEYQLQKLKKEEGESALAFSERQEGHDAMVHLGSLMDKLKKEKKPSGIVDAWDGLTGKEKVLMHPVIEKELSGVREDLAKLGKEDTVLNPWSPDQKQLHADLIKREERLLQADGGVQQAMSNDVQKQALVKASADKIAQARNVIDRLGRGKPSQVAMFDPDHPEKAFWADPGDVAGLKELGIIELPPMTAAEKQAHADQEASGREMAIETVAPGVAAVGRGLSRAVRGIQSLQGSSRNQ